ncbi:putative metallophosphoesterase [Pseudomonas phage phiPto-bp6g]|nr:putative metallophosphoesterase [Pseudomonas phage phiPto-bp6g]
MRKIIGSCGHIHQYDMRNFKGRIFFTTDLHGHYDLLHEALREVAFDETKDFLFVGGDWTDRGPYSNTVLDYINERWIASVRGNHEQMFIEGFEAHWHPNNRSVLTLRAHGGDWIWSMSDLDKIMIHEAFSAMPLGIEILLPNDQKVGIIHAEVPYNDWDQFKAITKAELDWDGTATAQWARTWYTRRYQGQVKGVDVVLVGHTPTDRSKQERLGNMVFADSGCHWTDRINLIEITEQFVKGEEWQ